MVYVALLRGVNVGGNSMVAMSRLRTIFEGLGLDDVRTCIKGAVLWRVDREHQSKSRMTKIVGTDLYKKITIRNPNTVRKLYDLMREADGQA